MRKREWRGWNASACVCVWGGRRMRLHAAIKIKEQRQAVEHIDVHRMGRN